MGNSQISLNLVHANRSRLKVITAINVPCTFTCNGDFTIPYSYYIQYYYTEKGVNNRICVYLLNQQIKTLYIKKLKLNQAKFQESFKGRIMQSKCLYRRLKYFIAVTAGSTGVQK